MFWYVYIDRVLYGMVIACDEAYARQLADQKYGPIGFESELEVVCRGRKRKKKR